MKLSVAMCTFNGEKFIVEQIESILNQTLKIDEIIVCDDKSTDRTIEILEKYAMQNKNVFDIHINKKNLKSVKNFEKAITLCTGDIIFLSDQDDIWELNKVAEYVKFFDNNPSIEVISSNGHCVNEKSQVIDKYSVWDAPEFLREQNKKFDIIP